MDLHLNVVINDLAVAIFQSIENQIVRSDAIAKALGRRDVHASHRAQKNNTFNIANIVGNQDTSDKNTSDKETNNNKEKESSAKILTLKNAMGAAGAVAARAISKTPLHNTSLLPNNIKDHSLGDSGIHQLSTPLDPPNTPPLFSSTLAKAFNNREIDALKKRDIGRREKYAANLSLMAGSPIDAYK
eukprot:4260153-Ditylum_brightwellii.AAC.1